MEFDDILNQEKDFDAMEQEVEHATAMLALDLARIQRDIKRFKALAEQIKKTRQEYEAILATIESKKGDVHEI